MLNRRSIGLLFVLFALILTSLYFQFNTAPDFEADFSMFTEEEIEWLKDHPVIKYAPDNFFYPYEFYENNEYQGLSLDYIEWIRRNYGLVIEIVEYPSWNDILIALKAREIDLITSTARSPQRDEYITFSTPYTSMDYVAFIRSSDDDNFFEYDLIAKKTAVVKNYVTQDILEQRHPDLELILVENSNEGFRKLILGEIDVFIAGSGQALKSQTELGITNIKANENIRLMDSVPLAMGTHKGNEPLASIMSKILFSMPQEEKTAIFDNWMRIEFTETFSSENYQQALAAIIVTIVAVLLIFLWNQLLKHRVDMKTKEVLEELHSRKELENQLKGIINAIPSPIYVKNSKGVFVYVNQRFCDLVGAQSPSDIEYKAVNDSGALKPDSHDKFYEMEDYVLRSNKPIRSKRNEVEFKNGHIMILNSYKVPFRVLGSPDKGIMSIDIDVTDLEKSKSDLRLMNEVLENKVKERSEAINQVNEELSAALENIQNNEEELQNTNHELTALLNTLRQTQRELIAKETMGAQGQNLSQIAKELTVPVAHSLERNKSIISDVNQLKHILSQEHISSKEVHSLLDKINDEMSVISSWLNESSRIVETFKLIALVDHGLQPTRINMKLMLETCYKQVIGIYDKDALACKDNLFLMASPNAFHQILVHLIRYTSSFGDIFESVEHEGLSVRAEHDENNLVITFVQELPENCYISEEALMDTGFQIIESILNHYFNGELVREMTSESISIKIAIPNMYIVDTEGGHPNA